jgi:hypothetical protein
MQGTLGKGREVRVGKRCEVRKVGCKVWRADVQNIDGEGATGEQVCSMLKGKEQMFGMSMGKELPGSKHAACRKEGAYGEQTSGTLMGEELLGRKCAACQKEGALREQTFGTSKGKEIPGSKHAARQKEGALGEQTFGTSKGKALCNKGRRTYWE